MRLLVIERGLVSRRRGEEQLTMGKPAIWLMRAIILGAILGLLLAGPGVPPSRGQAQTTTYTLTELGFDRLPVGINNHGDIVGCDIISTCGRAWLLKDGVFTRLQTLEGLGDNSSAYGINDLGQVVGQSVRNDEHCGGCGHGFLWTPGATDGVPANPQMKALGHLGGLQSGAFAINNSCQVVGDSDVDSSVEFETVHAVRWNCGDPPVDLGTLGRWSSASDINSNGQIVGSSLDNDLVVYGFLWDGGMTQLSSLWVGPPSPDWFLPTDVTRANAINDEGQIVGNSLTADASGRHAVLWENGGITDLGTLGGSQSEAFDINNHGQIVGNSRIPGSNLPHAFIWENGVMTDLNTLLPAGSTFTLVGASKINDCGEIIGVGRRVGSFSTVGYVLRPIGGCLAANLVASPG